MHRKQIFNRTGEITSVLPSVRTERFSGKTMTEEEPDDKLDRCARACSYSQRACDSCATWCARELARGAHQLAELLTACRDCADLCFAAAQIITRHGGAVDLASAACAEACRRCMRACEDHAGEDKSVARCQRKCHECEKACHTLSPPAFFPSPR
jgi:hypothetical protein